MSQKRRGPGKLKVRAPGKGESPDRLERVKFRGGMSKSPKRYAKLKSVAAIHAVGVLAKCAEVNAVLGLEVVAAIAGLENSSR